MLDIARHAAAEQGKYVGFFSLEMSRHQIVDRTIGGYLGVVTLTWEERFGFHTEAAFGLCLPKNSVRLAVQGLTSSGE